MNSSHRTAVDHYLIARCEARIDGATAHEVHGWIGNYLALSALAETDPEVRPRVERLERRLRAFCQSFDAARDRVADLGGLASTRPA